MRDRLARRSAAVGWAGSIALHGLVVLLAVVALQAPDTGFEFQAPQEIELGLVEATEVEAPAPVAEAAPEPEPETPATAGETGAGPARPDAGPRPDAQRRRRDAQPDAGPAVAGTGSGPPVAFLPAGAQLALRIDMDRIRSSPVGDDVRSLLRVIPDWQALLGGSDVDPVRDLSRVLVATPNLDRASLVIAGRLTAEAPDPRAIAERLADAQGVAVEWTDEAGIPRTRWPSPDATEREVALLGDRHFVIARGRDLPRVLAIAAARRGRRAPPSTSAADALLSMDEGEGLSIEIENVAAFVRRAPIALPDRLRVGMVEREDGVEVRAVASFARQEDVDPARTYLEDLVDRAAGNVLVALYGLDGPLERLDLAAEDRRLRAETQLRYPEMRTIFGLLRGFLERPPPRGGAPSPGVAPAPSPGLAPAPAPSPSPEPPPSPFE